MAGEEDDFEEVDADLLEVLDDGPELETAADEATVVGFREELIEALREPGAGGNPLAAIGEAAAELPEGIDALFDRITLPSSPPPTIPAPAPSDDATTDPAPPPPVDHDDFEAEFKAFMAKNYPAKKPPV